MSDQVRVGLTLEQAVESGRQFRWPGETPWLRLVDGKGFVSDLNTILYPQHTWFRTADWELKELTFTETEFWRVYDQMLTAAHGYFDREVTTHLILEVGRRLGIEVENA